MANKKRILRIKNAGLFDIEEKRVEALARSGWLPETLAKHTITFKRAEPCEIKCRLVYFEVSGSEFNRFVSMVQETGWRYVSSDGISQMMFIADASLDVENFEIPEREVAIVKRHRAAQIVMAIFGLLALAYIVINQYEAGRLFALNRIFIYAALLVLVIQWIAAAVSETRNIAIIMGKRPRRRSVAAYIVHMLLYAAIVILLCMAATVVLLEVQPQ